MRKADKDNPKNQKCRHCDRWDKETGYCDASGLKKQPYQTCRWFDWKDEKED